MKEGARLFSYIVEDDTGLAPNPYWDACTLAVCKPQIRRGAVEGDVVVGISPKRFGYRLLCVMKIDETLSFDEYYRDSRFMVKTPDMLSTDPVTIFGDNFYRLGDQGKYEQLWSCHSNSDGSEFMEKKLNDLSGEKVLVAKVFYYYGDNGQVVPDDLSFLEVGRGHKSNFSRSEILAFLRYLEKLEPGINGSPKDLGKNLRWLERVWANRKG